MKASFTFLVPSLAALVLTVAFPLHRVSAASPAARTIQITAKRFSYDPGEVTLKKGELVMLVLHSQDVPHGLRVRELALDLKAGNGGTAQASIKPEKTGDFVGHCSRFCGSGHGSMTLTFHVVP